MITAGRAARPGSTPEGLRRWHAVEPVDIDLQCPFEVCITREPGSFRSFFNVVDPGRVSFLKQSVRVSHSRLKLSRIFLMQAKRSRPA